MSGLQVVFEVSGIVGGFAVVLVPTVMWVGRRMQRANRADTEVATKKAIDEAIKPVAADMRDLRERQIRVETQFGNNGGSTLRDKVDEAVSVAREAVGVARETKTRLGDHLEQASEDRARLAEVERRLMRNRI